ncbi:MAG TPA: class I SAM-dependent methyltransferase [Dehalococcoidia bacterium]|nr:class I SAM-dependent methyltransferase [Dehalococcoidia bacterium]
MVLKIIGWIAVVILGWLVVVHPITKLVRRRTGLPDPTFIIYFINNPIRRKLQPPSGVIDHVHIQEGMNILELGPGTGFYTLEAARRAGPSGHVYAIDIKPRVIAILNGRVEQAAVKNITTKVASAYEIPLPSNSIDRAFMVHVLPEIPNKQKALHEIRRVLKKGGSLTLAEGLIDPDYHLQKTEIAWCRDAGFELAGSYGTVFFYVLTFRLT